VFPVHAAKEAIVKRIAVLLSAVFVLAGGIAFTQQPPAKKPASGKHYTLPATRETVQWGWFDVNEKP
jgi:hypothetical protein